jgi:hypothetical protein
LNYYRLGIAFKHKLIKQGVLIMFDPEVQKYLNNVFGTGIRTNQKVVSENVEQLDINLHLDQYIDYMTLYELFADIEYLTVAEGVMRKLRRWVNDEFTQN